MILAENNMYIFPIFFVINHVIPMEKITITKYGNISFIIDENLIPISLFVK